MADCRRSKHGNQPRRQIGALARGDAGSYRGCSVAIRNTLGSSRGLRMDKRRFLSTAGGASFGLMFGPSLLAQYATKPVTAVAEDEAFWAAVKDQFRQTSDYINLENGYYCFQPQP